MLIVAVKVFLDTVIGPIIKSNNPKRPQCTTSWLFYRILLISQPAQNDVNDDRSIASAVETHW